jgi:hypothetical protein
LDIFDRLIDFHDSKEAEKNHDRQLHHEALGVGRNKNLGAIIDRNLKTSEKANGVEQVLNHALHHWLPKS